MERKWNFIIYLFGNISNNYDSYLTKIMTHRVNALTSKRESNTPASEKSHQKKQVGQIQSQLTKQLYFGDYKQK